VRLLAAPLRIDEAGTTDSAIVVRETTFSPGSIRATYRFDCAVVAPSWRFR
jgi:hypothetical protein